MNWTFFSFALVFPLTFSLNEAFRRRENALHTMAGLKANALSLYHAHRDWDWSTQTAYHGGRAALPPGHVAQVRAVLLELIVAQCEVLLAPNVGRARHHFTPGGRRKREAVQARKAVCLNRIANAFSKISAAPEEMKAAGLPGNEAARIRQFSNQLLIAWEGLRSIKRYRTPITTGAFARLFILIHPFLMGPYYAYIAGVGFVPAREGGCGRS